MNVGDTVTHIRMTGTVVGVSTMGNPVVEWSDAEFEEELPENLIVVELPKPNEELDPTSDGTAEADRLAKKRADSVQFLKDAVQGTKEEKGYL